MAEKITIDIEVLRQLVAYNPATGLLTWLSRPLTLFPDDRSGKVWNTRYAGKEALPALVFGYKTGTICGFKCSAHRVAWALHFGNWPDGDIDHINGVKTDNRICNLRVVTNAQNRRNMKRYDRNKSGVTGVSWYEPSRRWLVRLSKKYIGYYATFEEAVAVRKELERSAGYHENHGRQPQQPSGETKWQS